MAIGTNPLRNSMVRTNIPLCVESVIRTSFLRHKKQDSFFSEHHPMTTGVGLQSLRRRVLTFDRSVMNWWRSVCRRVGAGRETAE